MDLDAALATVERACEDFKVPATAAAASGVLLAFRSTPGLALLAACRHILDRSRSLDARFHAAAALREGLVRDWAALSPEDRTALRSYLMSYLIAHCEEPGMQELDALSRNPPAQTASAAAAARRVGLQVLEAVVTEFSPATASPLGLPLEQHARCAADLQDHYLQDIFRHAVALGRAAAASHDGPTCSSCLSLMATVLSWDFRRTAPHPFAAGGGGGGGGLPPFLAPPPSVPAARCAAFSGPGGGGGPSAGADWASLLLVPDTLDWVAALLQQLTAAGAASAGGGGAGGGAAAELVSRARGVVVAMCNLSAEVFPREAADALTAPGGGVRGGYLRSVLRCVLGWLAGGGGGPRQVVAAAEAGDEAPLWEGCKALLALAAAHPPRLLVDAGNDVMGAMGGQGGFLALMQGLTLEVIRAGCSGPAASGLEQWVPECRDMLVEAWALMVQRDVANPMLLPLSVGALGPPQLPGLAEGAAAVFGALVAAAMEDAGREADGGEEVAAENEAAEAAAEDARMAEAAALARAAPAATFPLLASALGTAQQQLMAAARGAGAGGGGVGSDAWAVALERCCWLVRCAAHCLADSGAGETPLMPLPLSLAMEAGGQGACAAVEGLTAALLALPAMALREGGAAVMSPRLMEAIVWSLARWADTYLFPEEAEAEGLPAQLTAAFSTRGSASPGGGGGGGGAGGLPGPCQPVSQAEAVADGLARLAATCLVAFPGEPELHGMVCTVLLPVLSRRRPLCCCLLEASPGWADLAGAFAARRPQLTAGLAPKLQRWLGQSLCQAAIGYPGSDSPAPPHVHLHPAAAYLSNLLGPTAAELRNLAAHPDLPSLASRADVASALCGMLEVLRGGACRGAAAAGPAARAAGWALVSELLGPLLALQRAFGNDPRVGALLLKLAGAVVEQHVGYLPTDAAQLLMSWVLELLRQYRLGRAATVAVAVAAGGPGAQKKAAAAKKGGPACAAGTAALRAEAAADAARELRALLSLLTHITQRDVALAAAASDGWATSSSYSVSVDGGGGGAGGGGAAAGTSATSTPRSVNMGGGGGGGGGASVGTTPRGVSAGNTPRAGAGGGGGGGRTGSIAAEAESGVAQVVLAGLDVLLPMLTPELMAAATVGGGDGGGAGGAGGGPGGAGGKLARLLFSLLAYMMEVHPHAVAGLPQPHFATLLCCLEAGARGRPPQQQGQPQTPIGSGAGAGGGHFDGVVVQSALEGLAGLAKYHHQSLMNGGRGLSGHTAPPTAAAPGGAGGGPLVPYLLQLLLEVVLTGDAGPEVVELAGDALLPLLQCDPAAFAGLGAAMVQSADPRVAGQVGAALTRLVTPDPPPGSAAAGAPGAAAVAAAAAAVSRLGLDPRCLDLSRLSRRAFRERLCSVVSELRGLLRVR
ncbi:hypothetical protein GPECTOR_8g320 [Gonium pectorale]|uniref:Exportin-4 n=1 Tax=Gonium pectorale TaxID=33097 RepID=A0A150GSW7_GONPE|nr:hypothetical protein GPECTOR_8g320 [Gonium pectorale]|eukprot:KXZ52946.1 hypothetical protein GPECTOR_8g320 [Gonium pectorale]